MEGGREGGREGGERGTSRPKIHLTETGKEDTVEVNGEKILKVFFVLGGEGIHGPVAGCNQGKREKSGTHTHARTHTHKYTHVHKHMLQLQLTHCQALLGHVMCKRTYMYFHGQAIHSY